MLQTSAMNSRTAQPGKIIVYPKWVAKVRKLMASTLTLTQHLEVVQTQKLSNQINRQVKIMT